MSKHFSHYSMSLPKPRLPDARLAGKHLNLRHTSDLVNLECRVLRVAQLGTTGADFSWTLR